MPVPRCVYKEATEEAGILQHQLRGDQEIDDTMEKRLFFTRYLKSPFYRLSVVCGTVIIILVIIIIYLGLHGQGEASLPSHPNNTANGKAGEGVPNEPPNQDDVNIEQPMIPTGPLTNEERINLQKQRLADLPRCKPMLTPAWIQQELDPKDSLRDRTLITTVVPMMRCPETLALCYGENRCRPINSTTVKVLVRYITREQTIEEVEKELREDLECECRRA